MRLQLALAALLLGFASGARADEGDGGSPTTHPPTPLLCTIRFEAGWLEPEGPEARLRVAGGGLACMADMGHLLVDGSAGLQANRDGGFLHAGFGAYRAILGGSVSPYVGAGLDGVVAFTDDTGGWGAGIRLAGGLLIGRGSRLHVRIEGGWRGMIVGARIAEDTLGQDDDDRTFAYSAPFVSVGVGFTPP